MSTHMIFDDSLILMLKHIWHDRVIFYPLFLTVMEDLAEQATVISEILSARTAITLTVAGT